MEKNEKLRDLRITKGDSQADLANFLKITRQGYNNYENGKRQPDSETLKKLSSYFEVPIDYLLENDNLDIWGLGKALEEERKSQDIRLQHLAKHLRISPETLRKYEDEEIPMSKYIMDKACNLLGISFYDLLYKHDLYKEEIPEIFNGDVERYEAYKRAVQEDVNSEIKLDLNIIKRELSNKTHTIKIYGRIPAGIPLETIEDIRGEIEISTEWLKGDKEFIALEINGDSMYPKYLNGDIVILQISKDCETGQDCAVYVNGNDVTFKKVIKGDNYITLQPYNPQYPPQTYVGEQMKDIHILGIAKEIRRNI